MERASGSNSVPSATLDKSRVLDVKPLRTLVPMFPNPPQAPPFVCSSPFGPFPSGFSPFYPFSVPQGNQTTAEDQQQQDDGFPSPASAVPLRSFGTPNMGHGAHFPGGLNGDTSSSMDFSGDGYVGRKKRVPSQAQASNSSQKKTRKTRDRSEMPKKREKAVYQGLTLSQPEQDDGNRDLVTYVLLKFDSIRRRVAQLEESKEAQSMLINRADLRSGNIMMLAGIRTNSKKRIGAAPGIEIGDIFYFRMELCIAGLHAPSMAGIDYMVLKNGAEDEPVAVSIVSSGGYDDNVEDKDVLIYTGHGGNFSSKDKVATDQKLERGNLALDKSFRRGNEIRVIRGLKDVVNNSTVKIYLYDGLYSIEDSWIDKAKSGASSFKYKMVRVPGQPSGFGVWQSIQRWKQDVNSRPGLILPDLTSGAESNPIALVNDIDVEKGPPYFTYSTSVKSKPFNISQPSSGCQCRKECAAGDLNCACIRQNGGDFPYTGNGILACRKPLVYECGSSCSCTASCKNRVLQNGIKARLEVFKTKDKGWGLRSWDPIRAGTFICEYAGEVIDKAKFDRGEVGYNDYIFDTTRAHDSSFKWNYDPVLIDEEAAADINEESVPPPPLIVSAKDVGNVGRFMNHSCSPTVLWQLVVTEKNGESLLHVGFFAIRHIPPMTELTYDYGLSQAGHRRKQCLCGSHKCKGYFG